MTTESVTPNEISGNVLTGSYYAFNAYGGFHMERGFEKITRQSSDASFSYIDATDVIQILYDVRKINAKIGISKDASNATIEMNASGEYITSYDEALGAFSINKVTLTADDILEDLSTNGVTSIISVGKCETLYSDYEKYVRNYFGYFGGFASLFIGGTEFDISGDFTNEELYELMTKDASNVDGSYITKMTGSIEIDNVTELLRHAVDANIFNNRDPSGEAYEDSDISHNMPTGNFGVADGFIKDDLIYIQDGMQITLKVEIAEEQYYPINVIGPSQSHLSVLVQQQNANFDGDGFTSVTNATLETITRVVNIPLLMRLVDFDYDPSNVPTPATAPESQEESEPEPEPEQNNETAPYGQLSYDFEGTYHGWSNVYTSGSQLYEIVSSFDSNNPYSGTSMIASNGGSENRDANHTVMIFRSPEFLLQDPFFTVKVHLSGSEVYPDNQNQMWDVPQETLNSSYNTTIAYVTFGLRRVSDNKYIANVGRSSTGHGWEECTLTINDIYDDTTITTGESYTLDLIEAKDTSWGWLALDNLTITRPEPQPEPVVGNNVTLSYDFEGSHQGWSNVYTSGVQIYQADTSFDSNNPHSGSYIIAPSSGNANRDQEHTVIIFRSPEFVLDNSTFEVKAYLSGTSICPSNQNQMWNVPQESLNSSVNSTTAYATLALRRVSDNKYIANTGRSTTNHGWEECTITETDIYSDTTLTTGGSYTLDLIEAVDTSWGWLALDNVTITR